MKGLLKKTSIVYLFVVCFYLLFGVIFTGAYDLKIGFLSISTTQGLLVSIISLLIAMYVTLLVSFSLERIRPKLIFLMPLVQFVILLVPLFIYVATDIIQEKFLLFIPGLIALLCVAAISIPFSLVLYSIKKKSPKKENKILIIIALVTLGLFVLVSIFQLLFTDGCSPISNYCYNSLTEGKLKNRFDLSQCDQYKTTHAKDMCYFNLGIGYASENEGIEYNKEACKKIVGVAERDWCLIIAVQSNDNNPKKCEGISNGTPPYGFGVWGGTARDVCYANIAEKTKNPEICKMASNYDACLANAGLGNISNFENLGNQ